MVSTGASTFNLSPQIGTDGTIVWYGSDGTTFQIYKEGGSGPEVVSTGSSTVNQSPQIGTDGTIVWRGIDGTTFQIYKESGSGPEMLSTATSTVNVLPQIGTDGTIVWHGDDGTSRQIYKSICAVIDPIPTIGQWALLIMGLLMTSLGLIFMRNRTLA